jgi:hypothetical protein
VSSPEISISSNFSVTILLRELETLQNFQIFAQAHHPSKSYEWGNPGQHHGCRVHVSNYLCLPDLLCFTNYPSQTQQEHLFFWVWASCQFVTPSWRRSNVIKVKRHIRIILWNLNVKTPQICIVLFTAQPSRPTNCLIHLVSRSITDWQTTTQTCVVSHISYANLWSSTFI